LVGGHEFDGVAGRRLHDARFEGHVLALAVVIQHLVEMLGGERLCRKAGKAQR
jgi:hypothetical protein